MVSRILLVGVIVLAVVGGGALRLHMADTMKTDWDEDDYMIPAAMMRALVDAHDWAGIPDVRQTFEHPPLGKLLFGLTIDGSELSDFPTQNVRYTQRIYLPPTSLHRARLQSVLAGTLTILALALVSPLGGLALAVESIHVHYSSVAYLDALPTLFITLSVILYDRSRSRPRLAWLSAICMGIAVATKYPYAVAGGAVVLHALIISRWNLRRLALWGVVVVGVFFALNPYLWPDPVPRLQDQLTYHRDYTKRPIVHHHLLAPVEQLIHPRDHWQHLFDDPDAYDVFIPTDRLLFVLAIPGLLALLWRRSVYGWWLVLGLAFLMLWPAQWVQHTMLIVVPFSLSAGVGVQQIAAAIRRSGSILRRQAAK